MILKIYFGVIFTLLAFQNVVAQGPSSIDTSEPDPLPFTLPNILIFIVAPVLLFVFYIWWLKKKRKEREAELQKKNAENKEE